MTRQRILAFALLVALGAGVCRPARANTLVDPDGQIFFAGQDGVFRIDARAGHVEKMPITLNASRLLIDGAGNLCGEHMRYDTSSDLWRPAIWRYRKGEARIVTGKDLADTHAFAEVIDEDGNLYFREYDARQGTSRLLVRYPNRQVMLLAGGEIGARDGRRDAAQLGRIGAMTFARDGCLYFTDTGAVRKVNREGVVTTVAHGGVLAAPPEASENPLAAIAVDDKTDIYVADTAHRLLLRITSAGAASVFTSVEPDWAVGGLVTDRGGLYTVEKNSQATRVRRLDADLSSTILPVFAPGGTLLNRTSSLGLGLEQRTILDSPLFHPSAKTAAPRQQLPDPNQPK